MPEENQTQQPQGQQVSMEDIHDIYGRDCMSLNLIIKQQRREIDRLQFELQKAQVMQTEE